MNEFTKDRPTSEQLVDLIDNELDITICSDVVHGLDFEYKQLQQENKQLKEINEEHKKLNGELREENKKYKEVIDKIKDIFNNGHFEDGCDCLEIEELLDNLKEVDKEV